MKSFLMENQIEMVRVLEKNRIIKELLEFVKDNSSNPNDAGIRYINLNKLENKIKEL